MTPEQMTQTIMSIECENAALKEQIKTVFSRLDKQDAVIESLRALTSTIGTLADGQARIEKKLNGVKDDVDELRAKPGKRWDTIVGHALTALVGALVAFIMAKVGLN